MATYVIGDIHGCFKTLQRLLQSLDLQPQDRLWCVGDLINRGPHSLEVVEWAMKNQHRVQVVLGNHELHLLACYFGAETSDNDTLDELLSLSERDRREVLEWVRRQPLLYEATIASQKVAMVHAGVDARWTWTEIKKRAARIEIALRQDDQLEELAKAHPSRKRRKRKISEAQGELTSSSNIRDEVSHKPQWIDDLKWFTRVRTLDQSGEPVGWFKGSADELHPQLEPWFIAYSRACHQTALGTYPDRLFYGHWAAYGLQRADLYCGLDSAVYLGPSFKRCESGR